MITSIKYAFRLLFSGVEHFCVFVLQFITALNVIKNKKNKGKKNERNKKGK